MQAFGHWTYEHSGKQLMVVDLQGMQSGAEYTLTDPAIHCADLSLFGSTNRGE